MFVHTTRQGWLILLFSIIAAISGTAFARASAPNVTVDELSEMYETDQRDRRELGSNPKPGQWSKIIAHDQEHQKRVLELMKQNKLTSGDDYYHAAMIMQHGNDANAYMLAHIFAMAAVQRGNKAANWLSAASFDRLMQSADKPQVFGTQYFKNAEEPYRMREPIAPDLVTDGVRELFDVPTLAKQKEKLAELNSETQIETSGKNHR